MIILTVIHDRGVCTDSESIWDPIFIRHIRSAYLTQPVNRASLIQTRSRLGNIPRVGVCRCSCGTTVEPPDHSNHRRCDNGSHLPNRPESDGRLGRIPMRSLQKRATVQRARERKVLKENWPIGKTNTVATALQSPKKKP